MRFWRHPAHFEFEWRTLASTQTSKRGEGNDGGHDEASHIRVQRWNNATPTPERKQIVKINEKCGRISNGDSSRDIR
jgi:hypothetical protein